MPVFKPKNLKNIIVLKKNITTLDGKHKEMLDSFTADKDKELPKLIDEKKNIIAMMKNKELSIDARLDLTDKLAILKKNITALKKKEKIYLLNNSAYIFDNFENNKKIAYC